jgi:hypothetical protein
MPALIWPRRFPQADLRLDPSPQRRCASKSKSPIKSLSRIRPREPSPPAGPAASLREGPKKQHIVARLPAPVSPGTAPAIRSPASSPRASHKARRQRPPDRDSLPASAESTLGLDPATPRSALRAAVGTCLAASRCFAISEIRSAAWESPREQGRTRPPAASGRGGGPAASPERGVCESPRAPSGAAVALREDAMAEACLRAACETRDCRRGWLASRSRVALLETRLARARSTLLRLGADLSP